MKKIVLTIAAVAGMSLAGYSQGVISFNNNSGPGAVDLLTGSTLSYASSFTAALFYVSPTSSSLVAGPDAYGQLSYAKFLIDGFNLAATTGPSGAGTFNGGTATLGVAGGYSSGYTVNDYIALAAWTGGWANLATAVANNAAYGIITFLNPVGPGGADPHIPSLSGWASLTPTPGVAAFEGSGFPNDLVMAAVPEPTTIALAGLGGLTLLLARRKK